MNQERKIYLLNPRDFSPETIAVAFAKTSRSPESFMDIARELSDEKSASFHEKWVVGYGHSSVAEHAVLHLAFENVSRLAVEVIESNRLASYTEKSTRYQKWSTDAFYIPAEVKQAGLDLEYQQTVQALFTGYEEALQPLKAIALGANPKRPDETEEAWERRIRSQYVDAARFYLPAAALANVGMTANARLLESMIRKMLSHPLEEVREIGRQVKTAAALEIPTLVKYADEVPYQQQLPGALANWLPAIEETSPVDWCQLIAWQPEGEELVATAALFRYSALPFDAVRGLVAAMPAVEKARLIQTLFEDLRKFDVPLRELEHTTYTFDLVMDQGAYFEVKRHRMMTQSAQALTCEHGYAVPAMLRQAGIEDAYRKAMDQAAQAYHRLSSQIGPAAGYVVPNGFNRRVLMTMNFREAYAFCGLRSAPNAHFSVRRVAQRVTEEVRRVHPLLGAYLPVHPDETWQSVEEVYFAQV